MLAPNFLQLMSTATNILLAILFLRWSQLSLLNPSRPLTVKQPDPAPWFEEASPNFVDIYNGDITTFSTKLNSTESAVVLFYAPWSRSSIHFRPIFQHLAFKHSRVNFEFLAINCWQPGHGTCRQAFSLRGGYPYLSFFTHDTGHIFYTGVLSESEILLFLYKFTYPFYSAPDKTALAGLRLLASSSILIVVPVKDQNITETPTLTGHQFSTVPRSPARAIPAVADSGDSNWGIHISSELYKIGIRSVMAGAISVFVPQSVFPDLTPSTAYFYLPSQVTAFVPRNWTGYLPSLKNIKFSSKNGTTNEESDEPINQGIDRVVVAVVNSFLPSVGPQLCDPGVALMRAAFWLHKSCNTTVDDLLAQVSIGLFVEQQQCQQLRALSHPAAQFPPLAFKMLEDGGAELAKLAEIIGLGCPATMNKKRDSLMTSFSVAEYHAGVGVIFNHSASPSNMHHIGPRKPLHLIPSIYLLDGRQESPAKLINATVEPDSVNYLVDWLEEKYHFSSPAHKASDEKTDGRVQLPPWLPATSTPTLVYYEAPWCIFCSVLTPRIIVAARTLEQAVVSFKFVRVTDSEQVLEPTLYDKPSPTGAGSANVFSVPHYPALIFYPYGTLFSDSVTIAHSPGSKIVPSVWQALPISDKLLACVTASRSASGWSCWRHQWANVRLLQHRLWLRQEELLLLDDVFPSLIGCPKRVQLLRHLSALETHIRLSSSDFAAGSWLSCALRRIRLELRQFQMLQIRSLQLSCL